MARRNKGEERAIAKARIGVLMHRADDESRGPDADLADAYGATARRIAQRYQMPLPPEAKARICRKCGAYRRQATTRTRIHRGRIITTCACGHTRRRPL